jgi:UDP-N-acetylmuramyl tripeptide synthase
MKPTAILLALNDRIPDGRDVSWIWDVDFELLPRQVSVVVSGDRVYDLAIRLQYRTADADASASEIQPDLTRAVAQGLEQTAAGNTLYVLATYSAMLDVRKILTGKKIL